MPGTGSNAWRYCAVTGGAGGACRARPIEIAQQSLGGGFASESRTFDIPLAGAVVGQIGALEIELRGDVNGDSPDEDITVANAASGASYNGITGGPADEDDIWRVWRAVFSVGVIDLGGGVGPGIRLQVTIPVGVDLAPSPALPNGWFWEMRVSGIVE